MSEPIISVSGLRGLIGSQLTPLVAARYIAAYCTTLETPGTFIISRDGRSSGEMIAAAVRSVILGSGFDCIDVGVVATPTLGVLIKNTGAVAGVQISASHNPIEYNGLKLFNGDGRVIPSTPGATVLKRYQESATNFVSVDKVGEMQPIANPHQPHLDRILTTLDVEAIRANQFKVFVDSNRGAGSPLARLLLTELGCDVTIAGETPDGQFEHTPEPTAENLRDIAETVRKGKFAIGFCQDPDADRLALIDEKGRYIGEECTVAICLQYVLRQTPGTVVVNLATSTMNDSVAESSGSRVIRSKVGEANVVDLMLQENAVFGGEGNGGPIDPRVGLVRDSFVGMALTLSHMAKSKKPLSQIADELPSQAMIKDKIAMEPSQLGECIKRLQLKLEARTVDDRDGLRLGFDDGWLLLRGSNTEPIVRLIAEASNQKAAQALIDNAKKIIKK
jgi:phosphomannomutase